MKKYTFLALLALVLIGCNRQKEQENQLVSIQIFDRNGLAETVANEERLDLYMQMDFTSPQPYEKVLRIYQRTPEGKSPSILTSYHSNGQLKQYLEATDTRALGAYNEWHPNGKMRIEATVIEGPADLHPNAMQDWVFDDICKAWNSQGQLISEIPYSKGTLEGSALYYHENGEIAQSIPYVQGEISGPVSRFSKEGKLLEKTYYDKGMKHGPSLEYWQNEQVKHIEDYLNGSLETAVYKDYYGETVGEIQKGTGEKVQFENSKIKMRIEYFKGQPDGIVSEYTKEGHLLRTFTVKKGHKHGEEIEYFLPEEQKYSEEPQPKLSLYWDNDVIHGTVKTWYSNGTLESQKEFSKNKKNGVCCSWYIDGSLMFIEDYENDHLVKGSYYKRGCAKSLVSSVIDGNGTAYLYDAEGLFIKKISYVRGKPQE